MARKRNVGGHDLDALHCTPRDSVDALLASWRERRPELDFTPVAVISRLARVRGHIDAELDQMFAAHGLTAPSVAVLFTLARLDDAGVSQRRLMEELNLTSGTMSVRIDRLEAEGLVNRRPDPRSARNTLISLTDRGRERFESVVPAHLRNERRLLDALSPAELETLAGLLRKLLVEFEGSRPPADAAIGLGLTLAPAHVTAELREAVGLPPATGLLVRQVRAGGAAERAGLRTGDVLVAAGHRHLRSIADLYAAIDDAAHSGALPLRIVRGTDEQNLTVKLTEAPDGATASSTGRSHTAEHRL